MKKKTPQVSVGMVNGPIFASLEAMEATKKFNKFKAASFAEYETKVRQMSQADLFTHCQAVGIRANEERRQTIASLLSLFKESERLVKRYTGDQKKVTPMPAPAYANSDFLDKH